MDEIAHQISLLPVVLFFTLAFLKRPLDKNHILFALALAVSWVGDSIMSYTGGKFNHSYLWAPTQLALAYASVVGDWKTKRMVEVGATYVFVFWLSFIEPLGGFLLWSFGGVGLLWHSRESDLFAPIYIYFGLGTAAYFVMLNHLGLQTFIYTWYLYQAFRVLGILSFCYIVLRRRD